MLNHLSDSTLLIRFQLKYDLKNNLYKPEIIENYMKPAYVNR